MKVVWLVRDAEARGGIGTSWLQSWDISRDERSGRWTLWDRRDDRMNSGGGYVGSVVVAFHRFHSAEQLLEYLDRDEPDICPSRALSRLPDGPAREDIRRAVRERRN